MMDGEVGGWIDGERMGEEVGGWLEGRRAEWMNLSFFIMVSTQQIFLELLGVTGWGTELREQD